MKVLIVHPSDELYGADRVLLNSVDALRRHHQLEVWLPTDVQYSGKQLSRALQGLGISVRYVDLPIVRRAYLTPRGLWSLGLRIIRAARLRREIREFDLVYLNTSATVLVTAIIRRRNTEVLLHLHEHMADRAARLLTPFIWRVDRIAAVSHAVRGSLPARLQNHTEVINNGFEVAEAAAPGEELPIRLLLASRWNGWKGHREFLQALALTTRDDIRLTILGGRPASGSAVDVVALVNELDLHSVTNIVGEVEDSLPFIAESHLVVVPSTRHDPLPTIAIEALGVGRPVLASDMGGLREIVDAGNGWLLPNPQVSPADWVDFLEQLTPSETYTRMLNARSTFDQRFSLNTYESKIRGWLEGRES